MDHAAKEHTSEASTTAAAPRTRGVFPSCLLGGCRPYEME